MQGPDISLDDVARAAGVSPATASRALNGRSGVRDEVRTRVTLVAEGLGYRPNRAAKHLAGGRTSIIALVLTNDELIDDPYASAIVQSMAEAAREADEGLMLIMEGEDPNAAVRNLVADGLVEGVVISAVAAEMRWVEELLDATVPAVLLGSHPRRLDTPVVEVENLESSARMVGQLLDSGCRRVGTITGSLRRVCAALRLEGHRAAHHQRGLEADPDLIIEGDFTYRGGRLAADRLIDLGADAVFAANDEMAMAVVHRAIEREVDIPGSLSVAGFDGLPNHRLVGHRLSTVEQPFAEMARLAVSTLVSQIDGRRVPLEQLVTPRIILGSTTRSGPGQPTAATERRDR